MLNRYDVGSSRPRRDVELGQLVYIQDGIRPFGMSRHWSPVLREPWHHSRPLRAIPFADIEVSCAA